MSIDPFEVWLHTIYTIYTKQTSAAGIYISFLFIFSLAKKRRTSCRKTRAR